jgi:hypothetical protein
LGNYKEELKMPTGEARTYSIRGALSGAALAHEKIQLAWYDENYLYRILDFRVFSTLPTRAATVTGLLSKGKDDDLDPEYLQLEDESVIAWSEQIRRTPIPPGLNEEPTASGDSWIDADSSFGYDLWVHTNSTSDAVDVNYYILIERMHVKGAARLVNNLEQYGLNVRD